MKIDLKLRTAALLLTTMLTGAATLVPAFAADSGQIETVTVTAERRAENIQQVPMQVEAFSADQLASANVKTTQGVLNMVPNVSMDHSYTFLNSFVVVRGVAEINNADSPMAVIVDGVPQNNQKQMLMDLFDVQQVEILKGPQGGLYGRNAIGGAMIITTKAPTNHFEGSADASYGNGDAWQVNGSVSGPIVPDKLLFRLSADLKGDGGRIKNTYLNQNVDQIDHDDTVRGKLLAHPASWLTLDLRGSFNDFKGGAIWDSVVYSGNANDIQPPISDFLGQTTGHIADASFKFDADLGFATLTGITGHTDLQERNRGDLDFTNPVINPGGFLGFLGPVAQGQNLAVSMTSQELRLVSPSDQPFRWITGAYFIHTNRSLLTRGFFDPTHNPNEFYNPALLLIQKSESNSNNAWALYGQADYDLTSQLTLSGALRYDSDHRHQMDVSSGLVRARTYSDTEPKVTLTYHFDPDRLVYATYSTGFRSGGFNAPGVSIPEFKAETLTNYETGFKTSWLNRRLIFNGALYYEDDHDFQFFFVDALTASQIIGNLDKVHIWGVELETQAMVADGLQLFGSLGTTNTDIRKSTAFPGIVGNKTPKTVPWTLDLGFQY
ncbi:MAG: TonB-dependent receptor, partial [Alphaproteobacteria bacterium]|nr:TonB-dependent receptor [Alphaproteobacteria bacterium]